MTHTDLVQAGRTGERRKGHGRIQKSARRREARPQASEQRFRALFEQALLPMARFRPDGSMIASNEAHQLLFGATPEAHQAIVETYNLLQDEQLAAKGLTPLVRRAFTGSPVRTPPMLYQTQLTAALRAQLSRAIWLETFAYPIKGPDGAIQEVVLVHHELGDLMRAEQALRESEERLAHALDAGAIGLFDWNILEDRAICTDRYFEVFGLDPRGRTVSVNDWLGWVHPEDRERVRKDLRAVLEDGAPYDTEYRVIRQDGAERWVSSKAKPFFDPDGKPCRMIGTVIDITERKRAEAALRESQAALEHSRARLQALTARLLTAQEEERRRVSHELHDDLNQRLAALAMAVEALEPQLPLPRRRMRDELRALRDRVATLSDEIRRVAYQLHPSILEHLGLPVALKSYCAEFSRRERIAVRFKSREVSEDLPQEAALCLYRLAQEALQNLARHSRATRGTVTLAGSPRGVRLSIADHGVGFDPDVARAGGGLGLVSMEERALLVGGSLTVKSQRGRGTRIEATIPLAGASG